MNIHLVDCDSENLLYLFDLLTNGGFNVEASSDSVAAIERIAKVRPAVVFCEFEMPEIGGLEFLARARRASPATDVVLMARRGIEARPEDILERGGLDLLWKPCRRTEILRAVERVMHDVG